MILILERLERWVIYIGKIFNQVALTWKVNHVPQEPFIGKDFRNKILVNRLYLPKDELIEEWGLSREIFGNQPQRCGRIK